jgi:hypothetical protein
VRQITKDERVAKTFIFLGQTLPVSAVNIPYVLQTLDKLLPLYIFVETGLLEETETATSHLHANFEFIEGVTLSEVNQSFRQPQDEIGVTHYSNKIKRELVAELIRETGTKLGDEIKSGNGGRIDLVASLSSGEFDFYEIKPATLARHAIREALPQLLEYAYRKGGRDARNLFIVSQAPLDEDSANFLLTLRGKGLPVHYKQVLIR